MARKQAQKEKTQWGPGGAVIAWQVAERIRSGLRATFKVLGSNAVSSWSGFVIAIWLVVFTVIALVLWPASLTVPLLLGGLLVSSLRLGTTPEPDFDTEPEPEPRRSRVSLEKPEPEDEEHDDWEEEEEQPEDEVPAAEAAEVYSPETIRAELIALAWRQIGDGPGVHLEQLVERMHAEGLTGWTVKDLARFYRGYGIEVGQLWLPGRSNRTGIRREHMPARPGAGAAGERKAI
ncbi:hypothetical protein ACPC54_18625 [Kitasatospora sp. NPDC094028]